MRNQKKRGLCLFPLFLSNKDCSIYVNVSWKLSLFPPPFLWIIFQLRIVFFWKYVLAALSQHYPHSTERKLIKS